MKTLLLTLLLTACHAAAQRNRLDFNQDWQFEKDGQTTTLEVPHDWSFEAGISEKGTQKDKGGYYSGGTATYSKTFTPPTLNKDQSLIIHFDGVYMNSQVSLNGKALKTPSPSKLTTHLNPPLAAITPVEFMHQSPLKSDLRNISKMSSSPHLTSLIRELKLK